MKKFSELSTIAQVGIAVAVTAALVFAGEYLYMSGIRTQNNEIAQRVQTLKVENQKMKGFETRFNQVKQDNERLEAQLANLRHIVPEEKEADAFIKMVQEAGVQSGVNIRRFVAKPVAMKEFYIEMPFDINIDGNFQTVTAFFDRLSKLSRVINVTNLSMGPTVGGSVRNLGRRYTYAPNETVLASCTTTTFYSREAASAKK